MRFLLTVKQEHTLGGLLRAPYFLWSKSSKMEPKSLPNFELAMPGSTLWLGGRCSARDTDQSKLRPNRSRFSFLSQPAQRYTGTLTVILSSFLAVLGAGTFETSPARPSLPELAWKTKRPYFSRILQVIHPP